MTDRFRRAQWRMLLATMFCYLFYYTGRQTFGFAIPGIERELGIGKEQLGWASAVLLWSYAAGQAVNGNLGDRFGGRRMMSLGAVLSCGLNWIVSMGNGLLSLIVPWGLNGYVQSMGWAPGSRLLSNWWPHERRGRAYGFYVFAAGMSSVLSFVTSLMILDVLDLDWRWIFRLPVLLLLLGGALYYVVARDHPRELGFADLEREEASPEPAPGRPAPTRDGSPGRYRKVLGSWRLLVASVALGFQSMARYALLIWVPVHFLGEDYEADSSARWVSVALPVGMAFGALANGWLSDRLFGSRRWPAITGFMALAAVTSMAMYFLPAGARLPGLVALFLCGFFAYGPQSAFWALVPDLVGRARSGTGTGVMNFSAYLFAGIGEPLLGRLIETRGDSTLVFPFVAGACVFSAVVAAFIRR